MDPNIAALRRISFFYALSNALLGGCITLLMVLLGFLKFVRPAIASQYSAMNAKLPELTKLVMDFEMGLALPLTVFLARLLVFKEMRLGNKTGTSWSNFIVFIVFLLALGFCAAVVLTPLYRTGHAQP